MLLFKNQKMQDKIKALSRDILIHQDVEKELAKRSHYSQKIMKRMKDRIQELEDKIKDKDAMPKLNMDQLEPIIDDEMDQNKYGATSGRYNRKKIGHS